MLRKKYDKNPLLCIAVLYLIYTVCFFLLDNWTRPSYTLIHSSIDDQIPFVKCGVIFYCSWFILLVVPIVKLWLKKDYTNLWNLVMPMFLVMFTSLAIYLFWPNQLNLRPETITGNDPCALLVRWLESVDSPTNVCPSIHVATTCTLTYALCSMTDSKKNRFLYILWAVLICVSTLLIKQHSIIDVISGFLFGILTSYFWNHSSFAA